MLIGKLLLPASQRQSGWQREIFKAAAPTWRPLKLVSLPRLPRCTPFILEWLHLDLLQPEGGLGNATRGPSSRGWGASPDPQLPRKPKLISAPWNPSLRLSPVISELPSKGSPRNLSHSAVSFCVVLLHSCSPILPTGDGLQPRAWHLLHP